MLPHALDQSLIGHQKYFNLLKILYAQQTLHPCWILYAGQKVLENQLFLIILQNIFYQRTL